MAMQRLQQRHSDDGHRGGCICISKGGVGSAAAAVAAAAAAQLWRAAEWQGSGSGGSTGMTVAARQ